MPNGIVACQQRDGDAVEAVAAGEEQRQAAADGYAQHFDGAGQAGQRAGDGHGHDDVAGDVDAGIAGGVGVGAHRAQLKAQCGLLHAATRPTRPAQRQEQADVHAGRTDR